MKRLLLLIPLLILSLTVNLKSGPIPYTSIVRLTTFDGKGFCSGFVINEERHLVLTADHCLDRLPLIKGQPAPEVFHVPALDIAILDAPGVIGLDAFESRVEEVPPNLKIAAVGYAGGEEEFTQMEGAVIFPLADPAPGVGLMTLMSPAFKAGMSGGPILDPEGKVIGIVQMTNDGHNLSVSRPISLIREAIREFWP